VDLFAFAAVGIRMNCDDGGAACVCGRSDDGDGIGRCMTGRLSVEGAMDSQVP
jgi:hypothetical protein